MLNAHADALVDLPEVLTLGGQDARADLEQALALYERKGNLVMGSARDRDWQSCVAAVSRQLARSVQRRSAVLIDNSS